MTPEHSSKPLEEGVCLQKMRGGADTFPKVGRPWGQNRRKGRQAWGEAGDEIDQATSSWVGGRRGSRVEPRGVEWRAVREGERGRIQSWGRWCE